MSRNQSPIRGRGTFSSSDSILPTVSNPLRALTEIAAVHAVTERPARYEILLPVARTTVPLDDPPG
ncbi:hypothetical protein [Nocardia sp. NPDC058114]|uniref:hypothetical protein n=1 Tax=Nocardia sp. NPDC058114 TaxID=3346346 RepID=UPI0036D86BF8